MILNITNLLTEFESIIGYDIKCYCERTQNAGLAITAFNIIQKLKEDFLVSTSKADILWYPELDTRDAHLATVDLTKVFLKHHVDSCKILSKEDNEYILCTDKYNNSFLAFGHTNCEERVLSPYRQPDIIKKPFITVCFGEAMADSLPDITHRAAYYATTLMPNVYKREQIITTRQPPSNEAVSRVISRDSIGMDVANPRRGGKWMYD